MLIGLTGKAGCGKDTLADHIIIQYGYKKVSFADPLKEAAAIAFGIPLADFYNRDVKEKVNEYWGISPREMAQKFGTECMRNVFDENFWVKRAAKAVTKSTIIADVRFENEAKFIREHGILIHIERPNQVIIAGDSHASEAGVSPIEKDGHILNIGTTQDLFNQFRELMELR